MSIRFVWWKHYVICATVHLFTIHYQWCHVGSLKLARVRLFTSQIDKTELDLSVYWLSRLKKEMEKMLTMQIQPRSMLFVAVTVWLAQKNKKSRKHSSSIWKLVSESAKLFMSLTEGVNILTYVLVVSLSSYSLILTKISTNIHIGITLRELVVKHLSAHYCICPKC